MENERIGEVVDHSELAIPLAEEVIRRRDLLKENLAEGMEIRGDLYQINNEGKEVKSSINPDDITNISNTGPGKYDIEMEQERDGKKQLVKYAVLGAGLVALVATMRAVSKNRNKK